MTKMATVRNATRNFRYMGLSLPLYCILRQPTLVLHKEADEFVLFLGFTSFPASNPKSHFEAAMHSLHWHLAV